MRNRVLLSLSALLLTTLLLCAIGELVLRAIAPRSDPLQLGAALPNSAREYGLVPGTRSVQTGVEVITNSLGFREREYALQKPPGVRRVVVLGDSYTFGVGVEFRDTFSKRLERRLNDSGRRYEVINFGVSGYNTVLELATFREIAAAFKPDLVIVAYVANDAEPHGALVENESAGTPASLLTSAHLFIKERSLLYRYLAPAAGQLLGRLDARYAIGKTYEILHSYDDTSPGWVASRQALLEIADAARQIDASVLVVVFPMMVDFDAYPLRGVHETIIAFGRAHGLQTIDLLPRFAGRRASDLTVFLDGHPNARAQEIFADGIFSSIAEAH